MNRESFGRVIRQIHNANGKVNLSAEQRITLAAIILSQEETDNGGQILFYTGMKRSAKTGKLRTMR